MGQAARLSASTAVRLRLQDWSRNRPSPYRCSFPRPLSQLPSWQAPPKHSGEPCEKLHAVAQSPQCSTFTVRLVSQPLPALLSQFPYPVSQAIVQDPLLHEPVPLTLPQTVEQPPQ